MFPQTSEHATDPPPRTSRASAPTVVVVGMQILILLLLPGAAWPQASATMSDDAFLESLEKAHEQDPVDPRRLAKLLFSAASTLDGGRNSVRQLQGAVSVRFISSESIRNLIQSRYHEYETAVRRFKTDVSVLLDAPDSVPLLYQVLMHGHRACFWLDRYKALGEAYGVSSTDLMSVASSTEACHTFRRAAFEPKVESIFIDALAETRSLRRENETFREELRELEALLEDLRKIDTAP